MDALIENIVSKLRRLSEAKLKVLLEFVEFLTWQDNQATTAAHDTSVSASSESTHSEASSSSSTAWAVLKSQAGSLEAPEDWAIEHNHYLYGTPKRSDINQDTFRANP